MEYRILVAFPSDRRRRHIRHRLPPSFYAEASQEDPTDAQGDNVYIRYFDGRRIRGSTHRHLHRLSRLLCHQQPLSTRRASHGRANHGVFFQDFLPVALMLISTSTIVHCT